MDNNDESVVLADVPSEIEAQLIVAALEVEGIAAFKAGGFASDFKVGVPGHVQVLVRPEDLPRAQDAFDHLRDEEGEIDWSQVNAGKHEEE